MSIVMYDEIMDSFEEAYDDYLHDTRDYYDSAGEDCCAADSTQCEHTAEQAAQLTDLRITGAPMPDTPTTDTSVPDTSGFISSHFAQCAEAYTAPLSKVRQDADPPQADKDDKVIRHPQTTLPDRQSSDPPQADVEDEEDEAIYKPQTLLRTVTSDDLMTRVYPRKRFLVETLLTPGLTILAGAPKVGKSWLVLHLCMQIAKGEPFLGMNTHQGSVLYIALEDNNRRLQDRVYHITGSGSRHLHVATECAPIGERLDEEIADFVSHYRDTRLIVIDTFQKVREQGRDLSYANDYTEVSFLKKIADLLDIAILLVHHTRKQGDSDYMNEISGTNGIAGSADTLMVLKKENRGSRTATLSCTGRDIEDREMKLYLDRKTCVWQVKSDSLSEEPDELPEEIRSVIALMKEIGTFSGTGSEFAALLRQKQQVDLNPNTLKRAMNRYYYELQDNGVTHESTRNAQRRVLSVRYDPSKVQR